jgi:hypothetical protein
MGSDSLIDRNHPKCYNVSTVVDVKFFCSAFAQQGLQQVQILH